MKLADILGSFTGLGLIQGVEADLRQRKRRGIAALVCAGAVQLVLVAAEKDYLAQLGDLVKKLLTGQFREIFTTPNVDVLVGALSLATVGPDGLPNVRMVLLKGFDERGFVFYTNENSQKGQELAANPQAAVVFHWKSLQRQVRLRGGVTIVSEADADAYFATRSRDSQLGAWASDQSRPLESRQMFELRYKEVKQRFDGQPIPRPPHWGGYRLVPRNIEYWTDRPHRLHERRLFTRVAGGWDEGLLYP